MLVCLLMLFCTQRSSAYKILSQPYSLIGVMDLFSMAIYGFDAGGTADMEVKVSMANPRVATYNAMMQYNTPTNPNNEDRTMFFVSVCPYPTFRKAVIHYTSIARGLPKSARSMCSTDWYYKDIQGCLMIPLIAQKDTSKVRCSYVVLCHCETSLTQLHRSRKLEELMKQSRPSTTLSLIRKCIFLCLPIAK